MKRLLVVLLCSGLAATGLAELSPKISDAARPLDEGVPEVAVWRLQQLLPSLSGPDALAAKEKLAEALIGSQRPAEALHVIDSVPGSSATKFLRGQALLAQNRFEDALARYREVAADASSPQRAAASFQVAEMLRALERRDEAAAAYRSIENDARFGMAARLREAELLIAKGDAREAKRLLDRAQPRTAGEKRQKRVLRARVELLEHRPEKAIALLDPLLKKPEGATHDAVMAALFAMADAHLQSGTPELGDDYLEDFIDRHPSDPELARVFAKLDEVYRAERKAPRNELEKWTRDAAQPRRGFARWYLAQSDWRAGRRDDALRQFESLQDEAAGVPALTPALLQFARIQMDLGKSAGALGTVGIAGKIARSPEMRQQVEFETARALYGERKFSESAEHFQKVTAPAMAHSALLNASLAWLEANNTAQVQAGARALAAAGDKDAQADLALEQALTAAQRGDKKAGAMLQDFLRQFPAHPRAAEAQLALAELAFHAAPPKIDDAQKHLAAARAAHPPTEVAERADYLAIWLADARGADSDEVIASANQFLHAYPHSSLASEVRMKLAETHFRRQDFANAQTQFEILAQENPESPLTEKALFLAAQSAGATMASNSLSHALELLTQVVKMNGDLRWDARNEQAAIERRLGKLEDAQVLYDEVLKGEAGAAEKREALCGKADIFFEQASTDSAALPKALGLYDQLANEAASEPHWQDQALFKKGLCLEKLQDRAGALATFYRVLEASAVPGRGPEFFWFYKAGFNAARLLEEEQKWDSAVAVYEKLIAANGPRSDEAKTRLTQLRLDHFLWQ